METADLGSWRCKVGTRLLHVLGHGSQAMSHQNTLAVVKFFPSLLNAHHKVPGAFQRKANLSPIDPASYRVHGHGKIPFNI